MTREEIYAHRARLASIAQTPLGKAFFSFKNKVIRAWVLDTEDSYTDRNRKSTKIAHEDANFAEAEVLRLIEEVSHAPK